MIKYFIPFKSVGEFILGNNVNTIINNYDYDFSPLDESGLESYIIRNIGISLYVEDDFIVSIACNKECFYNDRNIINMNFKDFIYYTELISNDEKDEVYMHNGEIQDVYEFDNIGLQIWVKNNIIVTAIASVFLDD